MVQIGWIRHTGIVFPELEHIKQEIAMWRNAILIAFLVALSLTAACTGSNNPTAASGKEEKSQFVQNVLFLTQADTGLHQSCTGIGDATCSAQGPDGIAMVCQVQTMECAIMMDIDRCTVPDDPTANLDCPWQPCSTGDSCDDGNANTVDKCQPTDSPVAKGYGGICTHLNEECWVAKGSPCEAKGQYVCENGTCKCTASPLKPVNPTELCDNVDNDCNGVVDDGKNADSTAFDLGKPCDGEDTDKCKKGTWTCTANKMGSECVNESVSLVEACDGDDNDCDGVVDDKWPEVAGGKVTACDGDDSDKCANGAYMCNNDGLNSVICVESGKNVAEVCNGKDDTCDGAIDEGCDDDGDLYCDKNMSVLKGAACSKSVPATDSSSKAGDDCDDNAKAVNPGASEVCNSVDDQCNGTVDEGFSLGESCVSGNNDGVCKTTGKFATCAADGSAAVCDAKKDLTKVATEVCDNLDNDCDGTVDEGCDDDGDLYCDSSMSVLKGANCSKSTPPADNSSKAGDDCDDSAKAVNPGATEICNGLDDQCDTAVDEGCDDDADGFCDKNMAFASGASCKLGGANSDVGDCNDALKAVNPGATETCNGVDDECDGKIDIKADGSSACPTMCSAASYVIKCGDTVTLSMLANPLKGAVNATNYKCPTGVGTNIGSYSGFAGNDVYASLNCPGVAKVNVSAYAPDGQTGRMFALSNCSPNAGAYDEKVCAMSGQFYTSKSTGVYTTTMKGLDPSKWVLGFDSPVDINKLVITVTAVP